MSSEAALSLARRLWIYQAERFPVFKHGLLIAAFSSCGICLSRLLRQALSWPSAQTFVVAFVVLFGLFLQLRIADEFKDAEVDARYRPQRPVPRGLLSLKVLLWVAIVTAVIQVVACVWLYPQLIGLLILVWAYMALMSAEFFVPEWLKKHPVVYLWSHMLIMPLIDIWVSACDWMPEGGGHLPGGLGYFLALSFLNGVVLEMGRKTYTPAQEREGVETYSALWGLRPALMVWAAALILAFGCSLALSLRIGSWAGMALVGVVLLCSSAAIIFKWQRPDEGLPKLMENLSGVWVLFCYAGLGVGSLWWTLWRI
jgi:4-hydroxybenzoate polyprenyltransferase